MLSNQFVRIESKPSLELKLLAFEMKLLHLYVSLRRVVVIFTISTTFSSSNLLPTT
jgi:hypothetical protein